jgi:hypothetical protein
VNENGKKRKEEGIKVRGETPLSRIPFLMSMIPCPNLIPKSGYA